MSEEILALIDARIEHLNQEYEKLVQSGRGRNSYMDKVDGGLWQLEELREEISGE